MKEKGLFAEVRGTTGHRETRQAALRLGAIDVACETAAEAAEGADFILVATNVSQIPSFAAECAKVAAPGAIITDVGSIKGQIVAECRSAMPNGVTFIGSHPLAGSEKRGVIHADSEILIGAKCVITPTPEDDEAVVAAVEKFWQSLGMVVTRMTPAKHDAILANISHLPHLAASALVDAVSDESLPYAATGFRDTTRVAEGDARLWRDIVSGNSEQILSALGNYSQSLEVIRNLIKAHDYDALEAFLDRAAERRRDSIAKDPEGDRQVHQE